MESATVRAFLVPLALAVFVALEPAARARVDDAVKAKAAALVVKSGEMPHNVGEEIPRLDALRTKILTAIATKTGAQDYNLGAELKTLEQLDVYSARLADLVVIRDPNNKEVISWLQANAAVVGAWREAYTSTAKLSENTRLAEMKAIETRIGRKLAGSLGSDMNSLKATQDSASSSAAAGVGAGGGGAGVVDAGVAGAAGGGQSGGGSGDGHFGGAGRGE